MQNKKVVLISIIVTVALFVVGAIIFKNKSAENKSLASKEFLTKDYSYVKGNIDAKVEIVEFLDPACGTCAQFFFYVNDIMKKHDGKIKLVIRYAPFHQNSKYAVKILEASREQDLYLETLEFLFKTQNQWIDGHVVNVRKLWSMLSNIEGLDMKKLSSSVQNPMLDSLIEQDMKDVEALGISKTPTYYVNGEELKPFGYDNLVKLIESKL